ncbi:putative transcription factor, K-box [Rosa chinensis]|uniref:Putative transcription factor, K-box n=1 Tax=Rosa chinensis TaxID=74649 RepID=A0A2P6R1M4_ROSCH|nr:putative transcription factor, K-box [Rosa chinensis]
MDVIARYESHIENVGKLDRPSLELEHDCIRLSKELANKSRNLRQMNGEDLEELNIDELQRLEKEIEGCLNRVNQTKGAELMEASNQLRQDIGMLSNGSVTFESDISTAEEGWLSESATNASSCLSTDSSLDDHSGTDTLSLKLG